MNERTLITLGYYEEQLDKGFLGLKFIPEVEHEYLENTFQTRRAFLSVLWIAFLVYHCVLLALDITEIESSHLVIHLLLRAVMIVIPLLGVIFALARGHSPKAVQWIMGGAALLIGIATLFLATCPTATASDHAVFTAIFYLVFLFVLSGINFRIVLLVSLLLTATAVLIETSIDALSFALPANALFWVTCFFLAGLVHLYHREYTVRWGFLKSARMLGYMDRDAQTGLYSRCSFNEHLMRVWRQAARDRLPIALAIIDSEDLRNLDGAKGGVATKQAGDLMRSMAQILGSVQNRPLDMVARFDETQFVILWYGALPEMVRTMAEEVKTKLDALVVQLVTLHEEHPLSVEIGVAVSVPERGDEQAELLNLAQEALLMAGDDAYGNVIVRQYDRSWPADLMQTK